MMSSKINDTVTVNSAKVSCDGGEGALGHPRVFLNMGDKDSVQCTYCGRTFVRSSDMKKAS